MIPKIGTKAVCIKDYHNGGWLNYTGTVVAIRGSFTKNVGVDFGVRSRSGYGHNLLWNGDSGGDFFKIKNETGWWFPADRFNEYFRLLKEPKEQFEFVF